MLSEKLFALAQDSSPRQSLFRIPGTGGGQTFGPLGSPSAWPLVRVTRCNALRCRAFRAKRFTPSDRQRFAGGGPAEGSQRTYPFRAPAPWSVLPTSPSEVD